MVQKKRRKTSKKKRLSNHFFGWARLLHIYISAALFALLIFFCVTGYFLNHLEQFSGSAKDNSVVISVPSDVAMQVYSQANELTSEHINVTVLSRWLKAHHSLHQLNSVDFDLEIGEVLLDYSFPAGYASVIYLIEEQSITLDYRKGDAMAVLNDLHKGRHSGRAWSWVIDFSALFVVLFSLTGFALMFKNKKHRRAALFCAVLGLVSPVVLYLFFVPRILGV